MNNTSEIAKRFCKCTFLALKMFTHDQISDTEEVELTGLLPVMFTCHIGSVSLHKYGVSETTTLWIIVISELYRRRTDLKPGGRLRAPTPASTAV